MMTRLAWIAALSLSMACLSSCDDSASQVRLAFDEYLSASQAGDTTALLGMIDPRYIERYDQLVKMARTAEPAQIQRLEFMERLHICSMRNRLSKKELAEIDGRTWISRPDVTRSFRDDIRIDLGAITIRTPRALGTLMVEGFETGTMVETDLKIEMVNVEGKWLIDPTSIDKLIGDRMRKVASNPQLEDQIIQRLEAAASGKRVTHEIWNKPK